MQSGELFVTGEDEAIIALTTYPIKVKVDFKDECFVVPCNPHHYDELEWEVRHNATHTGHILVINWSVSGVREIAWTAWF